MWLTILIKYWKELVIVLLLIIITIFWQLNQNKAKELEKIELEKITADTIQSINSKLSEIEKRQKELYPQIDSKITTINNNIKVSQDKIDKLQKNQLTKEQVANEYANKSIEEISKHLNDLGYTNSIVNR